VNVALGMDSTTLNEDDDMLKEMRLAVKLHGFPSGLRMTKAPSPLDMLRMSTVNGARAVALEGEIGKLEPGRRADVTLIDYGAVCDPYVDPSLAPVEILVQRGRADSVDAVVCDGEVIVSGGEPTLVDRESIARELGAAASRTPEPRIAAWIEALREIKPHVARFYEDWPEPELEPTYILNSPE
jgi:5-methylthioadenosine/S-adenosylhomocysteine deaminase